MGKWLICDYCGCRDKQTMAQDEVEKLKKKHVDTPQREIVFQILEEYGELSNPDLKRLADSRGVTCGDEVARQMRPLTVTYHKPGHRVKFWNLAWRHNENEI